MADTGVSGSMVALVREAKGWKQADLASAVNASQGFISKIESGQLTLDEAGLTRFATALDVPHALLRGDHDLPGLVLTCLHHRRRSSRISAMSAKRIESTVHLVGLSARRLAGDTATTTIEPANAPGTHPAELASKVRAEWGLADGPIDDLVAEAEAAGVVVILRHLGTDAQDAVSMWPTGSLPMIVVNTGLPPDRMRFTVAHELGHLLMHRVPEEGQEEQANAFAAELLMPAESLRAELAGLTPRDFPKLAHLKARWRVSMAALIQRAHQLDVITPSQFKSFRVRLNQYGWAKREPGDLAPEVPNRLRARVLHLMAGGRTLEEVADLALMRPASFAKHYLPDSTAPLHSENEPGGGA